jgi:hypothetical protein
MPVDLDKLRVSVAAEDEEMFDEEPEGGEEDEEGEDDAALEDVKDLYDEDVEGAGKKRKRTATDTGDKAGKKKVNPSR